ncbi:tubulin-tyrosine ligase/Tubulin polyglutamylase, partial [Kipferlia bialata]|eukprot:g10481.t1
MQRKSSTTRVGGRPRAGSRPRGVSKQAKPRPLPTVLVGGCSMHAVGFFAEALGYNVGMCPDFQQRRLATCSNSTSERGRGLRERERDQKPGGAAPRRRKSFDKGAERGRERERTRRSGSRVRGGRSVSIGVEAQREREREREAERPGSNHSVQSESSTASISLSPPEPAYPLGSIAECDIVWTGRGFLPSEYKAVRDGSLTCILNHWPNSGEVACKDKLFRNIIRLKHTHPSVYTMAPDTYFLPGDYTDLVRRHDALEAKGISSMWMVKPLKSSQGRNIELFP